MHDSVTRSRALEMLQDPRWTRADVAEITGVSIPTLARWARVAGLPRRSDPRLSTALVVAMDAKLGPNAAARALGCSTGSVHYHRERARVLAVRKALRGDP